MPGAPLLIIRPDLIINWWNLSKMQIARDGTSMISFVGDEKVCAKLNVEETKAFVVFAKRIGDTLNVKNPAAPQTPQSSDGGDAGNRFAGLTGNDE